MILSHITGLQHIGIPTKSIDLSVGFYKKLGYKTSSNIFMEAGIPHILMVKKLSA